MKRKAGLFLFVLGTFALLAYNWVTTDVEWGRLQMDVDQWFSFDLLESSYHYFYLLLITFIPVLLLSALKISGYFYRQWKYLFPAIMIVATGFIAWDVAFTQWGVWGFNSAYLSGMHLFTLPLEEVLFFVAIPYACMIIYQALLVHSKRDWLARWDTHICIILGFSFLLLAFLRWDHMYTFTTFFATAAFIFLHKMMVRNTYRTKFFVAYLVTWIPFLLINGALTGMFTKDPVVIYNPAEYFGLRIGTIPVDDSVYSFLLLFMVVSLFELFRKGSDLAVEKKV